MSTVRSAPRCSYHVQDTSSCPPNSRLQFLGRCNRMTGSHPTANQFQQDHRVPEGLYSLRGNHSTCRVDQLSINRSLKFHDQTSTPSWPSTVSDNNHISAWPKNRQSWSMPWDIPYHWEARELERSGDSRRGPAPSRVNGRCLARTVSFA